VSAVASANAFGASVGLALVPDLRLGIESSHEFEVTGRLLTDVAGTLGRAVLSTPAMIAMMERTAALLVHPLLGQGSATVGFEVCVKHVAGAPEGSSCVAHVRLLEVIEDRKLRFAVEVKDGDGRTIGVGTHERRVIAAGATGAGTAETG
jgi:fluoroacetyl-CoA thioesterase